MGKQRGQDLRSDALNESPMTKERHFRAKRDDLISRIQADLFGAKISAFVAKEAEEEVDPVEDL